MSKRKPTDTPTLPPIATFADAVSQLMAFEEEFGPMQGAIVVGDRGDVRDGVVLTADWHNIDHALTYVLVGARTNGEHILLFSVMGDVDIRMLGESDVDAYSALAVRCADAGVHLADWLIAGGDHYRSMQLTLLPPEERDDPSLMWTLL